VEVICNTSFLLSIVISVGKPVNSSPGVCCRFFPGGLTLTFHESVSDDRFQTNEKLEWVYEYLYALLDGSAVSVERSRLLYPLTVGI
jgi:hypothetical protein